MIKDLIKLGADIIFAGKNKKPVTYQSRTGFTTKKYRTLKTKVTKYAEKKGIGIVKAADEILKGSDSKIFFQGLKFEGRGNKI